MKPGRYNCTPFLLPALKEKIKQHSGNYQAAGEQKHTFANCTIVLVVRQNACSYHTGDYAHTHTPSVIALKIAASPLLLAMANHYPLNRYGHCERSAAISYLNDHDINISSDWGKN
jgi:hypothetical protein